MAVAVVWRDPITGKTGFTALSTDTLPNAAAGSQAWITDQPGTIKQYDGTAWVQTHSGGAALVSDSLMSPAGTVIPGNVLAPLTATEANIITELAASGYTQLIMRFREIDGAATNKPGVYYVLNAVDPTTALGTKTACHFLALGDEAIHTFPADDPLTSVDIEPVGTMTNTILTWEYK